MLYETLRRRVAVQCIVHRAVCLRQRGFLVCLATYGVD